MLTGYVRVSRNEQNLELQRDALIKVAMALLVRQRSLFACTYLIQRDNLSWSHGDPFPV
jgi:hypothetical protein